MENIKIYEAISNVMNDVGAITKNKRTQQGDKYLYRGIDDVMNALNPAMSKNKIFVVPKIVDIKREGRETKSGGNLTLSILTIEFTFYAVDGSSVTAVIIGEAFDSGDKSINKAMSVAYKYACFQVFCIPTEEMQDPDAEVHEIKPKDKGGNANTGNQVANDSSTEEDFEKIKDMKINDIKIKVLMDQLDRTGVLPEALCKRYGIETVQDMTEEMFLKAIAGLKKTPDKKE